MILLLAEVSQSSLWSIIAGSGPVAAVLFVAVGALWRDNKDLRDRLDSKNDEHVQFLKDMLNDLE